MERDWFSELQSVADAPAQQAAPRDWFSEVNGVAPQAVEQPKEALKQGWGEWLSNQVKGPQDPREAGTKTVFEQFPNELRNPTANAAMMGADDAGMGDIISKNLGANFVRREKDANDYDVIVSRGPDGQDQRGYVNAPGLDSQDISRGIYGALPYAVTGGAVGVGLRGAGVGLNALAQGGAAAATSVAGDVGAGFQGSEQGIDTDKATLMGGVGAAGPLIGAAGGALWRKFVTIPGLVDKSTGQLTARGIEAAKRAGVDPADINPDFARSFAQNLAKTGNEAQAATQAGADRFGIPATRGQVSKDPYLLTQEEGMRRRLYGEGAQDTMRGFDAKQEDAVRYAALGSDFGPQKSPRGIMAPPQGIGEQINPSRMPGGVPADRMPSVLGESVQDGLQAAREGARQKERAAWKGATDLEVTPEALKTLPATLNAKLGGMMPNERVTPAAAEMAKEVERMLSGEAPEQAASWIAASPAKNVDQMRRSLLAISRSAANDADKKMSGVIYEGFNDWIAESASKNLLKGDPAAAMQLAKARGFTKEVREIFSPSDAAGKTTPAARRMAKVLSEGQADSGESVIQALLGSPGSRGVNDGTVSALKNVKTALDRFAPADQAKQAWDDIRLSYWTRLVTGKNGEMLGSTSMVNNIKSSLQNHGSVLKELYTSQELRQINQFARALEMISYKPPNASGSGYTGASFAKEGIMKFLDSFGLGKVGKAAMNYSGIGNALNSAAAKQATSQIARPLRPNVTPALTGVGNALYNGQSGGR